MTISNQNFREDRVDLAAAFRWTARLNMHEAVANHFSLAVNEAGTRFLMNPNQMHFARIRASDLIEIDATDPATLDQPNAPDPTAWGLHGAIHRHVPWARCAMHVHSVFATVLASLADSRQGARENLAPGDEPFELFRGFNEIFIVVGLSILYAGWAGLTGLYVLFVENPGAEMMLYAGFSMAAVAGGGE